MSTIDLVQHDNLSIVDMFKAYYNFTKGYLRSFIRYRRRYHNFLSVAYNVILNKYPINAKLRDGTEKLFNSQIEVWLDLAHIRYNAEVDVAYVNELELVGGTTNGDLVSIFYDKDYDLLPVKGRIVIDLGANIADSSIYFATRGAKKVYAYEPERRLYEAARQNISHANLSNVIDIVWASCSSRNSKETAPPSFSLEEIVSQSIITPELLKIDCEGCEYDIIMNSPDKTIRAFDQIIIEYHYGYRNLKRRLEQLSFDVKVYGPVYGKFYGPRSVGYSSDVRHASDAPYKLYTGYLFCRRA